MNLCVSHQNSRVQAKDAVTSSSALFSSFSLAHPHAERPAKMREKKTYIRTISPASPVLTVMSLRGHSPPGALLPLNNHTKSAKKMTARDRIAYLIEG